MAHINDALKSESLVNTTFKSTSSTEFTVSGLYNFEYTDPIDKSVSSNQGQVITFSDGSRVVFRLSGTGSHGATVRMYVERYLPPDAGAAELGREAADGLKDLIEVALEISKLKEFLGRDKPTVITVSLITIHILHRLMPFLKLVTALDELNTMIEQSLYLDLEYTEIYN